MQTQSYRTSNVWQNSTFGDEKAEGKIKHTNISQARSVPSLSGELWNQQERESCLNLLIIIRWSVEILFDCFLSEIWEHNASRIVLEAHISEQGTCSTPRGDTYSIWYCIFVEVIATLLSYLPLKCFCPCSHHHPKPHNSHTSICLWLGVVILLPDLIWKQV